MDAAQIVAAIVLAVLIIGPVDCGLGLDRLVAQASETVPVRRGVDFDGIYVGLRFSASQFGHGNMPTTFAAFVTTTQLFFGFMIGDLDWRWSHSSFLGPERIPRARFG
jgi:hypothetical protein